MGKRNQSALPGLELRKSDALGYPAMVSSVTLKSRVASSLSSSSCLLENIAKDHFPRVFCTKHMDPYLHGNSWCLDTTRDSFPFWGWKETGEAQVDTVWGMWEWRTKSRAEKARWSLTPGVIEAWATLTLLYLLPDGFSSGWRPAEDFQCHDARPRSGRSRIQDWSWKSCRALWLSRRGVWPPSPSWSE